LGDAVAVTVPDEYVSVMVDREAPAIPPTCSDPCTCPVKYEPVIEPRLFSYPTSPPTWMDVAVTVADDDERTTE
jgi:hypothetical protein